MLLRRTIARWAGVAFISFVATLPALATPLTVGSQPLVIPNFYSGDSLDSYSDVMELKTAYEKLNTAAVRKLAFHAQNHLPFNTAAILFSLSLSYLRSAKINKNLHHEFRNLIKNNPFAVSIKGGLKKWDTVIDKAFLRAKPKGDDITDILRFKILFDDSSFSEMIAFAEQFREEYSVFAYENRFDQPKDSGYRDINLEFTYKGMVVELILNLQSIDAIANKERKEIYERSRMGQKVDSDRKDFFKRSYSLAANFSRLTSSSQ